MVGGAAAAVSINHGLLFQDMDIALLQAEPYRQFV
jgi:hypothetical protein